MSRTNKTRRRASHSYSHNGATTWVHRVGNKIDRAWARQNARVLNVSLFDELLQDIAADQLEERGAFDQAMKVRTFPEPVVYALRNARWRGWWS